ncbi:5-oxoprolinase subunit PxpB [Niallia sp.]|uniref:5-oxoprolinase subunit PxpB n=1 Tax=Niallia sp. TaxID=2837523 RepID=UPI0028998A06|nr:5-oxoprolinase subunit PxpB [Niallia sp.]
MSLLIDASKLEHNILIEPFGDSAIVVRFGNKIDSTIHQKVQMLANYLEKHPFPGYIECVPAYTNVTVYYHPFIIYESYKQTINNLSPSALVKSFLEEIIEQLEEEEKRENCIVEIPVCYGGEYGPDIETVAKHNHLTVDQVIDIHSNGEYRVYMIGFAPGFPFLGGMSEKIAAPRRVTPRHLISAGSVGIAGVQTGIYPIATPGGWQLIGQTPLKLFLPNKNPPSLLQAGDIVKFVPISEQEFLYQKEETE